MRKRFKLRRKRRRYRIKKFGRFKTIDEFIEALKTLKVGEGAVFEGIDDVEIEVVDDEDVTENINEVINEENDLEAEERRLEQLLKEALETGDYEVYIFEPKKISFKKMKRSKK